jgi:lysophospholipase L1-like esterase
MAQTTEIYIAGGAAHVKDITSFSPTSEVDSLLSPKVNILLKKGLNEKKPLGIPSLEPNRYDSNNMIIRYNEHLNYYARKVNFPVVDINSLYEKILKGGYVTDDGVKIDASFPVGNFFSSDGINPTAFGQAVIANEVIKVLNASYKTGIPLIKTAEYLSK